MGCDGGWGVWCGVVSEVRCGVGGVVVRVYVQREASGLWVAGVVIVALIATRVFGHVELILLNNALVGLGRSWVPFANSAPHARTNSLQLQGTLAWEKLWESLVESSNRFGLSQITLNLHSPTLHEDFYATWQRAEKLDADEAWHISVPINMRGQTAGRLLVSCAPTSDNVAEQRQSSLDVVAILLA